MSEQQQQSDSNNENKKDEFLVPKIPSFTTKKPLVNLEDIKKRSISYSNNNQQTEQTESVKKFPPALTKFYPKQNLFYLEIIKDGISIEKYYLNKNVTILGRALDCDLIFEHYSISRYHAAFYWKDGLDDDGFFYLTDLNSSHGTFLNKAKIEQNKFLKLQPNKSFIKIGASTRLILFNKIDEEEEDDENTEIYVDPDVVNEKHNIQVEDGCSWGLDMDYESSKDLLDTDSSLQTVLNIINDNQIIDKTDNENAYSQNPQKTIANWFDYEGYEFEYTIQNENNKFKCTIDFPIDHQSVPITGDEDIKKKDAINRCCLKACRILDKAGILFPWQKNNKINKRKKDSDSDDDLMDETGERESKKQRLEAMKNKKVENLDTLTNHLEELKIELKELQYELDEMDKELLKSKTGNNSKEKLDDELDQYVKDVSTTSKFSINDLKIKKSQIRMKILKLLKDKERTEKLIKIAQPSLSFNDNKSKSVQSNNSNKINELIQKAQEKLKSNQKKKEDIELIELDKYDNELKNVFQEEDDDNNLDNNSDEKSKQSLTFNKSKMLLKPNNTFKLDDDDEYEKKKRPMIKLDDDDNDDEDIEYLETSKIIEKPKADNIKKNINNLNNNNKLINSRDAEEEMDDNDKIIEWLPPEEIDSCKSDLNDKYGY